MSDVEPLLRHRMVRPRPFIGAFPQSAGGRGAFRSVGPRPVADLRHVLAVAGDVLPVVDELFAHRLPSVRGDGPQLLNPVDDRLHQVEAVQFVEHRHIEGSVGGALLLVSVDMEIGVVGAGRSADGSGRDSRDRRRSRAGRW